MLSFDWLHIHYFIHGLCAYSIFQRSDSSVGPRRSERHTLRAGPRCRHVCESSGRQVPDFLVYLLSSYLFICCAFLPWLVNRVTVFPDSLSSVCCHISAIFNFLRLFADEVSDRGWSITRTVNTYSIDEFTTFRIVRNGGFAVMVDYGHDGTRKDFSFRAYRKHELVGRFK